MPVTFVSAYYNLYYENDHSSEAMKDFHTRMDLFMTLLSLNLHMVLFISEPYATILLEKARQQKLDTHLRIMKSQLIFPRKDLILPDGCKFKDNLPYLSLLNNKTHFLKTAIQFDYWPKDTHFAWIEFSLPQLFSKKPSTLGFLRYIGTQARLQVKDIIIPGCLPKAETLTTPNIWEKVQWRFCGEIFIGDRASLLNFEKLYETHYGEFSATHITWEVNFWAWLEYKGLFKPQWYKADHNDTMIESFPPQFLAMTMKPFSDRCEPIKDFLQSYCPFPFHPSSISHIIHNEKEWLNVRAINYSFSPEFWRVNGNIGKIISLNLVCPWPLSSPAKLVTVQEWGGTYRQSNPISYGIEDLRLWHDEQGQVRCIGTNVDHTRDNNTKMIVGNYDLDSAIITNISFLGGQQMWEKNWTPLEGTNRYIYKWDSKFVFTGHLNQEEKIKVPIAQPNHLFHSLRGSSVFYPCKEDQYIGVVHFSENGTEYYKYYYHMLMKINKNGELKAFTDPFFFIERQTEFCIGYQWKFSGNQNKEWHRFWISQADDSPVYMEISDQYFNWHTIQDDVIN